MTAHPPLNPPMAHHWSDSSLPPGPLEWRVIIVGRVGIGGVGDVQLLGAVANAPSVPVDSEFEYASVHYSAPSRPISRTVHALRAASTIVDLFEVERRALEIYIQLLFSLQWSALGKEADDGIAVLPFEPLGKIVRQVIQRMQVIPRPASALHCSRLSGGRFRTLGAKGMMHMRKAAVVGAVLKRCLTKSRCMLTLASFIAVVHCVFCVFSF